MCKALGWVGVGVKLVAARAATANGMAEAAEVGAAETAGGNAGAEAAAKAAGGAAED